MQASYFLPKLSLVINSSDSWMVVCHVSLNQLDFFNISVRYRSVSTYQVLWQGRFQTHMESLENICKEADTGNFRMI